jgi:hypothetical protein
VSENLLLHRRPAPHQRAVPSPVRPRSHQRVVPGVVHPTHPAHPPAPAEPCFAARNSPVDLLFRGLWQLVGGYVFLVLTVKDRKLPRTLPR